jgi:hypothetical protein
MKGVPMDFTETLPALLNGTIDACRSSMVVMGGMKFYNTAKHAFRDQTGMLFSAVWVSDAWMKSLPADLQKVLVDVGKEMDTWGNNAAKEAEALQEKVWADAGAKVTTLCAHLLSSLARPANSLECSNMYMLSCSNNQEIRRNPSVVSWHSPAARAMAGAAAAASRKLSERCQVAPARGQGAHSKSELLSAQCVRCGHDQRALLLREANGFPLRDRGSDGNRSHRIARYIDDRRTHGDLAESSPPRPSSRCAWPP